MSILYRACPHSRWTYGLAIAGVGGAVALYPAMPSAVVNPILQGQARASNVQVFEIMPTVAYKATKRLSVGFTPVLGLASLSINPLPLGMPATTPMQNYGTRYTWGGGFHLGAYYDVQNHWNTGFTFKSPLWTESMRFTGTTGVGQPHESEFGINLPMILGWGISYDGLNKTLLALDVKYFDYANTRGFRDIMDSNGNVIGLGWDSVTSVSVGMQRTLSERLKLRTGYCYNTNPTPSESQYANVSSPLFMQHVFSIGGTITLPKSIDAHLTWSHAFQNEVTGYSPTNPRVKVTNSVYADTLVFGLTKRF
jgi:long-chain fatty acid transport protein